MLDLILANAQPMFLENKAVESQIWQRSVYITNKKYDYLLQLLIGWSNLGFNGQYMSHVRFVQE